MRKGIMALEDNEEVVEAAEATDFVEAPENDLADAAEAEGEIDTVHDGIEEASETGETLEGINGHLEDSLENGGIQEPEARALEVAVEHMCARIGFTKRKKTFPAMEGFASKGSDRIRATKHAMEEIGSKISAIWAAIIAALEKAWEYTKTFFKSLFDATVGLKKRAENLEAQAKKTTSDHGIEGKKIPAGKFAGILTVDGKFVSDGALVTAYSKHSKDSFVTADRTEVVAKFAPKIEALAKKETITKDETKALVGSLVESGFPGMNTDEPAKSYYELTFTGAKFMLVADANCNFTVSIASGEAPKVPEEVEALTSQDAGKLAGLVAAHLGIYSKTANKIGEAINKISALASKLKHGSMGADRETARSAGIFLRAVNQAVCQSSVLLKGYDVKIAKAALDFVGASLAGLKQDEKPAKPEAPKQLK